jgi:hypothetical protein
MIDIAGIVIDVEVGVEVVVGVDAGVIVVVDVVVEVIVGVGEVVVVVVRVGVEVAVEVVDGAAVHPTARSAITTGSMTRPILTLIPFILFLNCQP